MCVDQFTSHSSTNPFVHDLGPLVPVEPIRESITLPILLSAVSHRANQQQLTKNSLRRSQRHPAIVVRKTKRDLEIKDRVFDVSWELNPFHVRTDPLILYRESDAKD